MVPLEQTSCTVEEMCTSKTSDAWGGLVHVRYAFSKTCKISFSALRDDHWAYISVRNGEAGRDRESSSTL
jgi:hypothetical protein